MKVCIAMVGGTPKSREIKTKKIVQLLFIFLAFYFWSDRLEFTTFRSLSYLLWLLPVFSIFSIDFALKVPTLWKDRSKFRILPPSETFLVFWSIFNKNKQESFNERWTKTTGFFEKIRFSQIYALIEIQWYNMFKHLILPHQ